MGPSRLGWVATVAGLVGAAAGVSVVVEPAGIEFALRLDISRSPTGHPLTTNMVKVAESTPTQA